METEITKIKIKLCDREIELTADEAREVAASLNKLFALEVAPKVIEREIHHHHSYPIYHPPIYVDRYVPNWPHKWEITCGPLTGAPTPNSGTLCMAIGQSSVL